MLNWMGVYLSQATSTHIIFTCQKRTLSLSSSLKQAGCSIGSKAAEIFRNTFFEFLQLHNLDLRWSIMNSSCSKKFLSWPSTFQFAMVGNLTCQIWLWRMNEKGKWTLIETNVVLAPSTADASFEFESCVNITKLTTQRNWIGLRAKRKSVGVCQKRAQIVIWPVTIGEKLRSRFGTEKLFSWKKINAFLYFSNDSQLTYCNDCDRLRELIKHLCV